MKSALNFLTEAAVTIFVKIFIKDLLEVVMMLEKSNDYLKGRNVLIVCSFSFSNCCTNFSFSFPIILV